MISLAELLSAASRYRTRHGDRALRDLLQEKFNVAVTAHISRDDRAAALAALEQETER